MVKQALKEFYVDGGHDSTNHSTLTADSRWLTRKQVANYIGISLSTVDYWASIGKLNKIYIDGSTRFDKQEIDASINGLR